ncbi:helicase C-terminal domain-containing protein [Thermoleptolyngbya sp.]
MIEVEVHQQLRAFLRAQGEPYWPHHLTMARLVARALRLGRSALVQAGAPSGYHGRYRLSYLMPALLWTEATVLVAPESVQQRLLMVEIPRLRQWIPATKAIRTGDRLPQDGFQGLLLTTPQSWLTDRLRSEGRFPAAVPTIFDGADDLERWARQELTITLHPADWDALMLACPRHTEQIRDARVRLTRQLFQHPANPYERYLLDATELEVLTDLARPLSEETVALPDVWRQFWQHCQQSGQMIWADVNRRLGQFAIACAPADLADLLRPVWIQQPVVLVGGSVDQETNAEIYRQRIGLEDVTCLKFSPDRQHEIIHLYLPDRFPLPNTPQFQPVLMSEMRAMLAASVAQQGLTVVLVGDVPLRSQIGSQLAAEYGSRVQVEKTCLDERGILVCGWAFWREQQAVLPAPNLLVIPTLPIPSLEEPLVSGRVAYYKQQRQDWFRLYLLPEALSELQRAIAPVRESQGVVALLDTRVNYRSYGQQVLAALAPLARINYLDASLFRHLEEMGILESPNP